MHSDHEERRLVMTEKLKQIRRPREADYRTLLKRTSTNMMPADYRCMLDNITVKCYVEAEYTQQAGDVVDIIRDRYGIPACFKVRYEQWNQGATEKVAWGYDYIQPADVTFFEFYDTYVPNTEYDEDFIKGEWEESGGAEE